MATFSIYVPDDRVPRVRAAFGTPGKPATVADVQLKVQQYIRSTMLSYERSLKDEQIEADRKAAIEVANAEISTEPQW
jgi:hypothetical protein